MVQAAHLTRQVLFSYFSCYVWLCNPMNCSMPHATLSLTISQSLLKCMSTESMMLFNHLTACHPLLHLPSIFPSMGCFPVSQLFEPGGQRIGASASILPMSIQGWFPLGLTGWISLQSKGLSRVFSKTTVQNYQYFGTQVSLWSNSHIDTWLLE